MSCSQLVRKSLLKFSINNLINKPIVSIRCVHSTNTSEIDYLMTRYRLTSKHNYAKRHSMLTYFNTITNFSYKSTRDLMLEFLQSRLSMSKTKANAMIDKYPIIGEKTIAELDKQCQQLSVYNFERNQYYDCPWILYLPISLIKERLDTFRAYSHSDLVITNDHLVSLLFESHSLPQVMSTLNGENVDDFRVYSNYVERAEYFAKNLDITHEDFCYLLHDHPYLFRVNFDKIKEIMSLLLSAGVKHDDIISGICIFKHNVNVIKQRLEELKQFNAPIKPWILRATSKTYSSKLRRSVEKKEELKELKEEFNCSNIIQFLALKLNCREQIIESIARQYPRLVNTSLLKLSTIITFLYDNGFVSYHVINKPTILFYKIDTLRQRKLELEKLNLIPSTLTIFTISKDEFKTLIDKLNLITDEHSGDHNQNHLELQQIKN